MRAAQRRQHRPGDGDLREHVDVELPAQVVLHHQLERTADADTGVVDERVEPTRHGRAAICRDPVHPRRGLADLRGICHIEAERDHPLRARAVAQQPLAGVPVAHAGQHGPAIPGEPQGRRTADARRCSRDQREPHLPTLTDTGRLMPRPGGVQSLTRQLAHA